jgi:hypothetical protein
MTAIMQTAAATTLATVPAVLWPGLWRPLAAIAVRVLACLFCGAVLLVAFAGAYAVKRHLGIDVVPRVDMLPDAQINAVIMAGLGLLHP